jgi:DNA-binding response OmpR family regulator
MAKILVVEDEDTLLQTLRYNLTKAGHDVRLSTDGAHALELARTETPDAIVLDLMLPGLDGLEVCRQLRRDAAYPLARRVPILMLTARDDEVDKVVGLELGADDYLTKPFSMRELLARVKALVRRAELARESDDAPTRITSGELVVDFGTHRAYKGGELLRMKPREFDLLAYFMRHPGQALTRDRLLERVWGYDFAGDTRTVDVHVRWLRSKVEADASNPELIQTVRGVGYLFTGSTQP